MNNIILLNGRSKQRPKALALFHEDYPKIIAFTKHPFNKRLKLKHIINIINHETIHSILSCRFNYEIASKQLDQFKKFKVKNKWMFFTVGLW